jgi:hypothetical protein
MMAAFKGIADDGPHCKVQRLTGGRHLVAMVWWYIRHYLMCLMHSATQQRSVQVGVVIARLGFRYDASALQRQLAVGPSLKVH